MPAFELKSGERLNCKDLDPDLFFGIDGEHKRDAAYREQEAMQVCEGCPALDQCLDWAMAHNEAGVWGGTTEDMRDDLRLSSPRWKKISSPTPSQISRDARAEVAWQMFGEGDPYQKIGDHLGLSAATVYEYIRKKRVSINGKATAGSEARPEEAEGPVGSSDTQRQKASTLRGRHGSRQ